MERELVNLAALRDILEENGITLDDREGFVNIIGVRVYLGEFNDWFIFTRTWKGLREYYVLQGTTEPGQGWLLEMMGNIKGTAILVPGHYEKCWTLGVHKGKYPALVQKIGYPFKVWRDKNKNGKADARGTVYTDARGINLHTTKQGYLTNFIGKFSAGCQVVFSYKDFMKILLPMFKEHSLRYKEFNYTLLTEQEFERYYACQRLI